MSQELTKNSPQPPDEPIDVGTWLWVKDDKGPDWLGCVTHIGSNYIEVSTPAKHGGTSYVRIHFDEIPKEVVRHEYDADRVIAAKIQQHRDATAMLMDEVKQLTAKLGITPAGALPAPDGGQTQALVAVHGTQDVQAHKQALIKAKEETLPQLFEKIKEQHEGMAMWMKARLIPMEAETKILKQRTASISDRIFVVELYAGLVEEVACIRDGEPAGNDEKIHLFQRRHYMDEECLYDYDAGGMEFKDIAKFDAWLMRDGNRERLLPLPKCIVAFQVRRYDKEREATSLYDCIAFGEMQKADKLTYLYMRNGDRYFRLGTAIEFGAELFPDEEYSLLRGGELFIKRWSGDRLLTIKDVEELKSRQKADEDAYKRRLAEWRKQPKDKRGSKPWRSAYVDNELNDIIPVTPKTVYYDDAMAKVADQTKQHNRIAVVLQGLLDRSPVFQPHPPWRLWTPEGFVAGVELHYDASRALTDGAAPDFEAYRARLNASIALGTHMVGQQEYWEMAEAERENKRQANDWRIRQSFEYKRFKPYGNPGPGLVAKIANLSADKAKATFRWTRQRQWTSRKWWRDDVPQQLPCRFLCPIHLLLNVDAYTPGDYKQFYLDPRTRSDYIRWAPLLLRAEDFHAGKMKESK